MSKITFLSLLLLLLLLLLYVVYYLFHPLSNPPKSASFIRLDEKDGTFQPFTSQPKNIYGIGLSYQQHIIETAASFNPNNAPPIFRKELNSILIDEYNVVKIPAENEIKNAMNHIENGLFEEVNKRYPSLQPLVDYEVELGIIILEDINLEQLKNEKFIPKIGFFITNDISERCLAILGDGKENQYDYWGISKSYTGFLPLPKQYWQPTSYQKDQLPFVQIQTFVNGILRQEDVTQNMIYTPTELINHIIKKYKTPLFKGDLILTGTPGGTAIYAPRWKLRLGNLLNIGRFKKLETILKSDTSKFLKHNDEVIVNGDWLGNFKFKIE